MINYIFFANFTGMNICKRLKNRTWKQYALYGKQLKIQVKKGLCFSHQSKENLIKSGTYFSALSFDENFIAAATCDPANVNRLVDDQGGTEKIFLYNLKEMNVSTQATAARAKSKYAPTA